MRNMLAAFAVAFAPVFAPALAADGTNDANDTDEQLRADIARLEGKIDTLTKTVVSKVASLTTKVDSAADALAAVDRQLDVRIAIFQSNSSGMAFAGGNLPGVYANSRGHIELAAGLYEVEIQRWGANTAAPLYIADGDHVKRVADQGNGTAYRVARAVMRQSGGVKQWTFHPGPLPYIDSYYTNGRRPPMGLYGTGHMIVRVRRLSTNWRDGNY